MQGPELPANEVDDRMPDLLEHPSHDPVPPGVQRDLDDGLPRAGLTHDARGVGGDRAIRGLDAGGALRVPGDGIPPARSWSDRNPEADARLKAARAAFAELSETLAIPVENLLTPELLRRVAWEPPEPLTTDARARVRAPRRS